MRFENQQGRYMMHCHNLVHEDHDMMGQFLVGDDHGLHHPVRADRAKNLPAGPLFGRPGRGEDGHGGSGSGGDGGGPGPSKPKAPNSTKFKKKKKKSKRCKTVTKKVRVRGKVRRKKVVKCTPKARRKV